MVSSSGKHFYLVFIAISFIVCSVYFVVTPHAAYDTHNHLSMFYLRASSLYNSHNSSTELAETIQDKTARTKLAFAITITKDGNFIDAATILAYSVVKSFCTDAFEIAFVAFVHPNVTTSRPLLQAVGYKYVFLHVCFLLWTYPYIVLSFLKLRLM